MLYNYDRTSKWSILEYSKLLLGKTLEEAIAPNVIEARKGKGRLGQLVEEYFFGYDVNSNPDAGFSDAGLELKVRHSRNSRIRFSPSKSVWSAQ